MSRALNRLCGRVFGWFDSKEARTSSSQLPSKFDRRARLALQTLEDRAVPATFTVTNTNDSGPGSLRQAIIDANATAANDDIVFDSSFSSGDPKVILLNTAFPDISATGGNLTIQGPGANKLVIARGVTSALNRPFNLLGTNTYTLNDFTIFGFSGSNAGGAINVAAAATVNLNNMHILGNFTTGFAAGLYMVANGNLTVKNSTFIGNTSNSNGGAIRMSGTAGSSSATFENCTIVGNKSLTGGGLNFNSFGGAGTTVNIRNTTISGNTATTTTTSAGYGGGGISRGVTTTALTINIESSIVAGNTGSTPSKHDISVNAGAVVNIDANSVVGVVDLNGTISGTATDPRISQPGYHQGSKVPVVVPLRSAPISPAVDIQTTGTPPGGMLDQTGTNRGALPYDAGAVESVAGVPFAMIPLLTNITTGGGASYTFSAYFYDDTGIDADTVDDGGEFLVTGPNGFSTPVSYVPGSYNPTTGEAQYTFTPPGGTWDGNDIGFYTITLQANKVKNTGGTPIASGFEGAFAVVLPTPTAAVTGNNNLNVGGGTTHTFTVTYTDVTGGGGMDASTFGDDDVRVTGPNSFNQVATKVSVDTPGDGSPRTVTYQITAPGGTWDVVDKGTYTVSVEFQKVANTAGIFVPPGNIGTFSFALADTFTVTNTNDSGAGSLRQAIEDANANAGAQDIIVFSGPTFSTPQTITLLSALPITDPVTIDGKTADGGRVTLSGGGSQRILNINGAGTLQVEIKNLNLTSASASTRGGAVFIQDENVTFTDVNITNSTSAANGGAIGLIGGPGTSLTLVRTVLSSNKGTIGGAIDSGGSASTVSITDSSIFSNTASAGNGGAFSGAFVTFKLANSAVYSNSASSGGGGLHFPNAATINISNSTLSGNTANGAGGAAINIPASTTYIVSLNIRNSTITLNKSSTTGASASGGINWNNTKVDSNITLNSTIIAGNLITSTSTTASPDLRFSAAKTVAGDNNLIGVNLTSETNATFSGTNPLLTGQGKASPLLAKLNALAGNGGPTFTHSLQADSPAIDAGNNIAPALTTDQRGTGFPREMPSGFPDIGAFEYDPNVPSATVGTLVTITDANAAANDPYVFTVTYKVSGGGLIDFTTTDDSDEIRVIGPGGFNKLATFVSAVPSGTNADTIVATYKFTAPVNGAAGWDFTDNGVYTVSLEANQVKTVGGTFIAAGPLGTFSVVMSDVFTVTNTNDSGSGSLRQAILDANTSPAPSTINFDPSFSTGVHTITFGSEIPISGDLTINGPGANHLILQGGAFRHFNIATAGTNSTVIIRNLTMTGANATVTGGSIINADEYVTLEGVYAHANSSTTSGGFYYASAAGSKLTVLNSTIANNSAANGGAFYTISSGSGTSLFLYNSTIANNIAATTGGVYFANSTDASTVMEFYNSTLVGNSAGTSGGTVRVTTNAAVVNIFSTIVAGNSGGASPAFLTATVNATDSVIDTLAGYTTGSYTGGVAQGTPFVDLNVSGTLLNNGGPMPTLSISSGPLVNVGSNAKSFAFDQRGTGFPRELPSGKPDIGAFEFDASTPTVAGGPFVKVTDANKLAQNPYVFSVTYSSTLQIDGSSIDDGDEIRITGPGGFDKLATFVSASPTGNAEVIVATYKFNAPVGGWTSAHNGTYTIALEPNQVKNLSGTFADAVTIGTFKVALATTYIVTNTNDDGAGSLRQAIADAEANVGVDDIIQFEATTFSTPQTIVLTGTEIKIADGLSIQGPGKNLLTVTGNSAHRIFAINDGVAGNAITVVIQDMTLTDATVTGSGGAVTIQDENVTFRRTIFTANKATTSGGAITVVTPNNNSLTIENSHFKSNQATGGTASDGGAIHVGNPTASKEFTLFVRDSVFSNNTANDDGGAINLGAASSTALYNFLIENSLISGNTTGLTSTTGDGGGMYTRGTVGSIGAIIRNSTISGNLAKTSGSNSVNGGGLAFPLVSGNFQIFNSTIVNNTSNGATTLTSQGGGGISINGTASQLTIVSSVVAGNVSKSGKNDISAENNVSINKSAVGFLSFPEDPGNADNIPYGKDLFLGSLADNGGQSFTHAILPGSPLLNAGVAVSLLPTFPDLTTDQRGSGFSRSVGAGVDIGAFERVPGGPPVAFIDALPNVFTDVPGTNNPYTFKITYADDTLMDISTIGNFPDDDIQISKAGGGFSAVAQFVSADKAVNSPIVVATYKFTPPGGTWDSTDNGTYEISLLANTVKNTSSVAVPAGVLGGFSVAVGGVFVVTNTNDSGPGSLRNAVELANLGPSADTITFSSLFSTPQTISLTSGQIQITQPVTINGPGAHLLSIDANAASRHFLINDGDVSNSIEVTIKGMKLHNGAITGVSGIALANRGGSINYADEKLTVDGLWLTNNYTDGGGGAIGGGGDSITSGYLYIYNSTIAHNTAKGGDSIMGGGGVLFTRTLDGEIKNSTIVNNVTTNSRGGGINFYGTGTYTGTRNIRIESTTIANNSASSSGGGFYGTNGGTSDIIIIELLNTIVAENTASSATQIDFGNVTANYSALSSSGTITGSNNIIDPTGLNLGTLQNNGGNMPTVALEPGSVAIDAGSPTSVLTTDQRGTGFARVVGTATDMGAFEVQGAAPVFDSLSINSGNAQRSRITTIDVTFTGPVDAASFQTSGLITLTRIAPTTTLGSDGFTGIGGFIVNTGNGLVVTQNGANTLRLSFANIVNNGVENASLADGRWQLAITPASFTSSDSNPSQAIRRLFGDADGNGTTDGSDLGFLGFGSNNPPFDIDNNGTVDGSDFSALGGRFGVTI